MLFSGPREITVGPQGITQRGRFWFRPRKIAWEGVAVSYIPARNSVMVIGSDGTTVTHCEYHVAQLEFVGALRRHGAFFHGDKVI